MLPLVLLQKPLFTTQSPGLHIVSYGETTMGLTVTTVFSDKLSGCQCFKVFCTGMHEIDKIEYSRGCSVNICEYSIFLFYLVVFFSEWEADGNFLTRVSGSEK